MRIMSGVKETKKLRKTIWRLSASLFLTISYVATVLPVVHLLQERDRQSATTYFVSNLFSYDFGVFAATFFGESRAIVP